MHLKNRISVLIPAAIISIAAFYAGAQTPRTDFNRPQTFDVQHYAIRASFDRARKQVLGDTTVTLKPLKSEFRVIELDAVGLSFETVKLDPSGIELPNKSANGKIVITLDKAYAANDLIVVRLKYKATPKKGVYFIDAQTGKDVTNHSQQIWTQGEPDEARHWFPGFDFPSDKATTEQFLTVQKDETVIANGELIEKAENTDGTVTWHYRMSVPHSTYLVSFVIGKYVKIASVYKDIPLAFYVYPGKEQTAMNAFGETRVMMRAFEDLTGIPYPYTKNDQTIVSGFRFGGMENITATTLSDTDVFFANFDFGRGEVRDLVSHELAHSWFGNLVTCRNWAELWLNEGFATYMEAVYLEKTSGRDAYLGKVRTDAAIFLIDEEINKKRHALFNQRAGEVSSLFENPATTYHKGGAVIHTLREQVGAAAFWKALNIYLNRHRFGSIETPDLRKAMEETSGQDLGWFFDQWVYSMGAPKLDVRQSYSPRTNMLTLTLAQTQKPESNVPAAFRLPMDVEITTTGGVTSKKLEITKRIQTFTYPLDNRPTDVELDALNKIPLKTVRLRPLVLAK